MKKDITNVLKMLLAICIGLWVCWLLSGCSPRIVEVEKPVIVENTHTQTHTDIVRERFFGSGNGIPLIAGS